MRILFIMSCLPQDAPYVAYYEYFLQQIEGITIDYIIWDRENQLNNHPIDNWHIYKEPSEKNANPLKKFISMLGFRRYMKRILSSSGYDRLIIFTIPVAILFFQFRNKYEWRYVVDIRDHSPLLNIRGLKKLFQAVVANAYQIVVSSPRFTEFINTYRNVVVSHNIHINGISLQSRNDVEFGRPIKIMTIGQIRHYQANVKMIELFAPLSGVFELIFVGVGKTIQELETYCGESDIRNVRFRGRYAKSEEDKIVEECDLINAFMPDDYNSRLLLSNRLYLSLRLGKPIIVNENTFQGVIVKKYHLGLSIRALDELPLKIEEYIRTFDIEKFNKGRAEFYSLIESDYEKFKDLLSKFIKETY